MELKLSDIEGEIWLDANFIAHLFGVSIQHIHALMRQGKLPSVKLGTLRRVPKSALLDWVNKQLTTEDNDNE